MGSSSPKETKNKVNDSTIFFLFPSQWKSYPKPRNISSSRKATRKSQHFFSFVSLAENAVVSIYFELALRSPQFNISYTFLTTDIYLFIPLSDRQG